MKSEVMTEWQKAKPSVEDRGLVRGVWRPSAWYGLSVFDVKFIAFRVAPQGAGLRVLNAFDFMLLKKGGDKATGAVWRAFLLYSVY